MMINCGNIYLNGKTFTMFFNKEEKKRVFLEARGTEYVEPTDEDKRLLTSIYDNKSWIMQSDSSELKPALVEDIKKKASKWRDNLRKKLVVAGVAVGITVTLFAGAFALSNHTVLVRDNDFIEDIQPVVTSIVQIAEEEIEEVIIDCYGFPKESLDVVVNPVEVVPIEEVNEIVQAEVSLADQLMTAINSNPNLTSQEKEHLNGYKQFFVDYGHLLKDPNKTIEALSTVTVSYTGLNYGNTTGNYDGRTNHINIYCGANCFEDIQGPITFYALFHEFGHVIQFSNYDKEKESTEISRSVAEGVNAIITFEYLERDHNVKMDYLRDHAIIQVLLELVDNPDIVINMWLNDTDEEVCKALAQIMGTEDDAKSLLEKTGIVHDSERVMNMVAAQYHDFDLVEVRKLISVFPAFSEAFEEAFLQSCIHKYGDSFSMDRNQIMDLFDDMKFMDFLERTYNENLWHSSNFLKGYYEAKNDIDVYDDSLTVAYFDIIDTFTALGTAPENIVCVNKSLINKQNIGNDSMLTIYRGIEETKDFTSRFYVVDLLEYGYGIKGR